MTKGCIVIKSDLGVQSMHFTSRLQDQWVNFGQVAVAFGETAIQLHQNLGHAVDGLSGNLRVNGGFVSCCWR